MKPFPHYTQLDAMDCGPTCLRMIAKPPISFLVLREKYRSCMWLTIKK
ncbi:MAG: hypothetical protein LBI15_03660 [Dysgonamonadaceae bacterium]|nr:hypothetical protein [Dysgonamonadaceae bacterium]